MVQRIRIALSESFLEAVFEFSHKLWRKANSLSIPTALYGIPPLVQRSVDLGMPAAAASSHISGVQLARILQPLISISH